MARQVQLRSNLLLLLVLSFLGCENISEKSTLKPLLNAELVDLQSKNDILFFKDNTFSGSVFSLYPSSKDTSEIKSYLNGKEDGKWVKYYPNKKLKEIRFFKNGLKEGKYIAWWQNGKKQLLFHFVNDEYEGICSQWNEKGQLVQQMTYVKGHEDGAQKMFYDDGKVRSNYIIKDGRRFGLLGTKNCVNVKDSVF